MEPNWNQNGTEMEPKWNQNGTKIEPTENQNGTKVEPKWNQHGTNMEPKQQIILDFFRQQSPHEIPSKNRYDPQLDCSSRANSKWIYHACVKTSSWTSKMKHTA